MNIAMITVRRDIGYVYPSLLSLFASGGCPGPVHMFVGSDDSSYLEHLKDHPRFVTHPMETDKWQMIAGWGVHRRFSYNYWRTLDHFAASGEGLCLCEDDVIFTENFWDQLTETVTELDRDVGRYVLALYSAHNLAADPALERGRRYLAYPAGMFFGTQCMYYPAAVIREQADRLRVDGVDLMKAPGDLIVRDLCIEQQYLYASRPSLVQHIGVLSTGLGYFHSCPMFGKS